MGGSFEKFKNISSQDKISQERYMSALDIERSNHANELAKKAERLRLLYKTRFEEDLRAFLVSRKAHGNGLNSQFYRFNNSKPVRADCGSVHKCRITSRYTQNNLEIQKTSFIPTWAWPASLRNSEGVRLVSLFYTAETNVPLSPTQVGGNLIHKPTRTYDIASQGTSKAIQNSLKILKLSKKYDQDKLSSQPTNEPNNLKQNQRQKLRSKYGTPFTWIQNKSKENLEIISSPQEGLYEISTPQSQVFAEIPKQPNIYPLGLEREINTGSSLSISEFVKKSCKMQKALELLLEGNQENCFGKSGIMDPPIFSDVK